MLLLGIDCGGDRTLAALSDPRGNPVGRVSSAPAPSDVGLEGSLRRILEGLQNSLESGDTTVVVAMAGLDRPGARQGAAAVLRRVLPDHLPIWICSTLEAELAGTLGGRPGVVIHAGMRAAAAGLDRSGRVWNSGEREELLGDEGSALWLATRTLQLVVRGLEGRMDRSPRMERALIGYFGCDDMAELLSRVDAGHIPPGELASSVSVVLDLASYPGPEPACRALVLKASRELVQLTRQVASRGRWSGP
ncbi:MAG: BadF/BadG/BcrA/BcrD ATPase family protein, partial [Candidatus Eremiobacterota bacterium]